MCVGVFSGHAENQTQYNLCKQCDIPLTTTQLCGLMLNPTVRRGGGV
jgi:hypothetical protein